MMSPESASENEFVPATPDELSRFVRENANGERRSIMPVGGRTALSYGDPVEETATRVSMARLSRIVDYPARDMTITVEGGMRLDALASVLNAEKQRLPVDVAQSHRATVGGAIATNTSGPRRFAYGTLRNYVIGITAVDGTGRLFKAGSRVVKNVAGYDLCKLLVGSMGTLAITSQVTLRLWPVPESSVVLWQTFDSFGQIKSVLDALLVSETRPMAIEVLDPIAAAEVAVASLASLPTDRPVLCVGFEGARRETEWQVTQLQTECARFSPSNVVSLDGREATLVWNHLIEFQTISEQPLTFQASLLPSRTIDFMAAAAESGVSVQAHAGNGVVIGRLSDEITNAAGAAELIGPLRQMAEEGRGRLTVLDCEESWKSEVAVFGRPQAPWSVMRKLKNKFDPYNVLNRGRMPVGSGE